MPSLHQPPLPHNHNIVTTFGLEAEHLYRAHLERFAASSPASWYHGLNPGLLGQLHLPPNTGNRNISSSTTLTYGQPGRRKKIPTTSTTTTIAIATATTTATTTGHHQQQSGNGEAPPMMFYSLCQEGRSYYQSSHPVPPCDIQSSRASHLKLQTIRTFLIFLQLATNLSATISVTLDTCARKEYYVQIRSCIF